MLRDQPWGCWYPERRDDGHVAKQPRHPTGYPLSTVKKPHQWIKYAEAADAVEAGWPGVGILLTGDDLVGVDLDHIQDLLGKGSALPASVQTRLAAMLKRAKRNGIYIEHSPSGDGLRAFVRGQLTVGDKSGLKKGGLEIYSGRRFLTVTGHVWSPGEVIAAQWLVDEVVDLIGVLKGHPPSTVASQTKPRDHETRGVTPELIAEVEARLRQTHPRHLAGDETLWTGQGTGRNAALGAGVEPDYPSQSEADCALACAIARALLEAGVVDREPLITATGVVFDRSGLARRDKWQHAQTGYRQRTLEHAAQNALTPAPSEPIRGALVHQPPKGPPRLLAQSIAAEIVAQHLRGTLTLDAESGASGSFVGTHWEIDPSTGAKADKRIADLVHDAADPLGFNDNYLVGVTHLLRKRDLLPRPEAPVDVVPFRNGILDLKTQARRPATPDYALDYVIPHAHDPDATCPTLLAWLLHAVGDDPEVVAFLRAWLAALVRGLYLQTFLVLIGPGGSGKGTFQRLVRALIGETNIADTSLRELETDKFERTKLLGKRLCMINEANKHTGSVDTLKAITGGDPVAINRKHVQQSGSFTYSGLVLMAANEHFGGNDATSGIERRRRSVRFPNVASDAEKATWRALDPEAQHPDVAALHAEIPGLINWILELPTEEIHRRMADLPSRIRAENRSAMAVGNSAAEWLTECCVPVANDHEGVQIGTKSDRSDRLYANYIRWCDDTGRSYPVSLRKFSDTLVDISRQLGYPTEKRQHSKLRTYFLYGLRLRATEEAHHAWDGSEPARSHEPPAPEATPDIAPEVAEDAVDEVIEDLNEAPTVH
jgi:putative DNA primase/helicase